MLKAGAVDALEWSKAGTGPNTLSDLSVLPATAAGSGQDGLATTQRRSAGVVCAC